MRWRERRDTGKAQRKAKGRRRRGERHQLIKMCNTHRKARGLRPVKRSRILNTTAQAKAVYLAKTDQLEHGSRWFAPIEKLGGRIYGWKAENIGYDDRAADVDRNWRNSPAHAANYFSSDADFVGIGRVVDRSNGRIYYVQHFAGKR